MKRYSMSFAYDVPHYVDFVVEAENAEEAEKIAQKALDEGRFADVGGSPCYDNADGERVFLNDEAGESDDHLPKMDEIEMFKAGAIEEAKS